MDAAKDQETPLERRVESLRRDLKEQNPRELARLTGATLHTPAEDQSYFLFPYWNEEIILPLADYTARDPASRKALPVVDQAMIAYYFHDSRSSAPASGWISFSELPDGQFYAAAFQGYTSQKILTALERDYAAFSHAAESIGWTRISFASQAYRIPVFPKVAVLVACWKGDEELPPSYQILFQDTVINHLPTDACAILGSMVTAKLLKAHQRLLSQETGGEIARTQGQVL